MFTPEPGETRMSMRMRVSELQLLRATLSINPSDTLASYVHRRISEISATILKLEIEDKRDLGQWMDR